MPTYGSNPQVGLEKRSCASCGKVFQPYRSHQIACSRSCRDKTKDASPRRREYELACQGCGETFVAIWTGMGRAPSCSDCTKAWKRSREDRKNTTRRGNPKVLAYSKEYNFRRYGITREKYEELLSVQNGLCAICGRAPTPGTGPSTQRLHIDHCHESGTVRGLLCGDCNTGLGLFQDDIERLLIAVAYLREGSTDGSSR